MPGYARIDDIPAVSSLRFDRLLPISFDDVIGARHLGIGALALASSRLGTQFSCLVFGLQGRQPMPRIYLGFHEWSDTAGTGSAHEALRHGFSTQRLHAGMPRLQSHPKTKQQIGGRILCIANGLLKHKQLSNSGHLTSIVWIEPALLFITATVTVTTKPPNAESSDSADVDAAARF